MKKIKRLLFTVAIQVVLLAAFSSTADSQPVKGQEVGELIYMEGIVKIASGQDWSPACLSQKLLSGQRIKTATDASAEIKWVNGTKTAIGPSSEQAVGDLYNRSAENVKGKTEGLWARFTKLFSSESAERQEEGGIRRSQVLLESKDDAAFSDDEEEMTFEKAASLYQEKEYLKAATAFQKLIEQQPAHSKANFALFAQGHCYVELNNVEKAKETLGRLIEKYPDDELSKEARQILEKL